MVFIKSFKNQTWLFPPALEDLIPEDHVCFLVENFIDSLDFSGFKEKYEEAGAPAYHPGILLKLLVMGVLDKVRSSRRPAKNARENVVYMHLAEKLTPDFRTISDFRKNNPDIRGLRMVKTEMNLISIANNICRLHLRKIWPISREHIF